MVAVLSTTVGCLGPGSELAVGQAADGPGFFTCRVTMGTGTGFFRQDALQCDPVAGSPYVPYVEVTDKNGAQLGSAQAGDGKTIKYYADAYPVRVEAHAYLGDTWTGLESGELRMSLTVDSAESWATPHGPSAPFDELTITVENRTNGGVLRLEPWDLALDGAELRRQGQSFTTPRIAPRDVYLQAGEIKRLRLSVSRGTIAVRGSAGDPDGTMSPFEVGTGSYALTESGLQRIEDLPPPAPGTNVAACAVKEASLQCRVIPRPGLSIENATASWNGVVRPLPSDGSPAILGPMIEPSATVSLTLTPVGIEGLAPEMLTEFRGDVEVRASGEASLALPFGLMHVQLSYQDSVEQTFFDAEDHIVRFSRPLKGLFESQRSLLIALRLDRPDVWVAVTSNPTEIAGKLTLIERTGVVHVVDATLRDGGYSVGPNGLGPLVPPAPGQVLASCWVGANDSLTCQVDGNAAVRSASVSIHIEAHDLTLSNALRGSQNVVRLTGLFPVSLELRVDLFTQAEPVTATTRIESSAALPASAPLVVRAP